MATESKVKWSWHADYFQVCNCDYGCPCEFEAPPTQGWCEGAGAYRITSGSYGDVSLAGRSLAWAATWPAAIHLGNGTAAIFIDDGASPEQRDALIQIASGAAGGLPFEILATTFTKLLEPQFVPFQFDLKGKNSTVKVGDNISIAFEPVKNPVTGEAEGIKVSHETGFIFKEAEVVSAKEGKVSFGELNFSWPNKAGFLCEVDYGN